MANTVIDTEPEPDICNQLPHQIHLSSNHNHQGIESPQTQTHTPPSQFSPTPPRTHSQGNVSVSFSPDEKRSPPSPLLTSTNVLEIVHSSSSTEKEGIDLGTGTGIASGPGGIVPVTTQNVAALSKEVDTGAARRRIVPNGINGNANGNGINLNGNGNNVVRKDFVLQGVPTSAHAHPHQGLQLTPGGPEVPKLLRSKTFKQPTWGTSIKNTIKSSYVNTFVVFIPISWALHFSHQSDVLVFVFSLLAVIPLASLLGFATEQLALRTGEAIGGLLNATFGNAVELIIAILALVKGDIDLVQASMIGSILSNTLLVLGMSYFAGGLRFHEQVYLVAGSNTMISMLGLSMAAIVLPAGFHYAFPSTAAGSVNANAPYKVEGEELQMLLKISRGLSFILLAAYAMYLVFILYTHAYLFKMPRRAPRPHTLPGAPHPPSERVFPRPSWVPSIVGTHSSASTDDLHAAVSRDSGNDAPPLSPNEEGHINTHGHGHGDDDEDDEIEEPLLRWELALVLLLGVTAITGITAEWLVHSIDGMTEATNVSREFVGLILLPVIGNSVEHIAAVTVSVKDKLNLSMAIAIGSSIQVSLGLLPLLVLIGWGIGQPMLLFFDTFETITLAVSLLLVNFAIADGKTNYLEGGVLMLAWIMIAVTCWFYDPLV